MEATLAKMWRERAAMHEQQAMEASTEAAAARYRWFAKKAHGFAEFHAKLEAASSTGARAATRWPQIEPLPPEGGRR